MLSSYLHIKPEFVYVYCFICALGYIFRSWHRRECFLNIIRNLIRTFLDELFPTIFNPEDTKKVINQPTNRVTDQPTKKVTKKLTVIVGGDGVIWSRQQFHYRTGKNEVWKYPTPGYIQCILRLVMYSQAPSLKYTINRNMSVWR